MITEKRDIKAITATSAEAKIKGLYLGASRAQQMQIRAWFRELEAVDRPKQLTRETLMDGLNSQVSETLKRGKIT